MCKLAI
jgi:hypothetical protein